MSNVHVAVQVGREPSDLVKADSSTAWWDLDVEVFVWDGQLEFRGPVVQGKRGERFIYLTWGEVTGNNEFEMFRRAKLMLNRTDENLMGSALVAGRLLVRIVLTGADGGPRCARVEAPAIEWSVPAR